MNRMREIIEAKVCPYCNSNPSYVDSKEVYSRSYGMIYLCKPCDAFVGVHKGTSKPLGRLANKELREWKKKAHAAFDPIWINHHLKRSAAYKWLSEQLGIDRQYCHVGMFDVEHCKRVASVSTAFMALCKPLNKKQKFPN